MTPNPEDRGGAQVLTVKGEGEIGVLRKGCKAQEDSCRMGTHLTASKG
jgi:hypothetical protein